MVFALVGCFLMELYQYIYALKQSLQIYSDKQIASKRNKIFLLVLLYDIFLLNSVDLITYRGIFVLIANS